MATTYRAHQTIFAFLLRKQAQGLFRSLCDQARGSLDVQGADIGQFTIDDEHFLLTTGCRFLVIFGLIFIFDNFAGFRFELELIQRGKGLKMGESILVFPGLKMGSTAAVAGHDFVCRAAAVAVLPGFEIHLAERPLLVVQDRP